MTERIIRCEAEFKAEHRRALDYARPQGSSFESVSLPTTTDTGALLRDIDDTKGDLESLLELGQREGWLLADTELRLTKRSILGAGGFGVVAAGSFLGTAVAIKIPVHKAGDAALKWTANLGNELRILRKIRHPNIVLFHGICTSSTFQGKILLVLGLVRGERMDRFVLRSLPCSIGSEGAPPTPEIPSAPPSFSEQCLALVGVAQALTYLHSRRPCIVHGDLKPSNIMVEHGCLGPRAKLLDFGMSRVVTRRAKRLGGTTRWMAPEVMHNAHDRLDASADVFSFGRLAYFVATKQFPFAGFDESTIKSMVNRNVQCPYTWPGFEASSEQYRPLVESCLNANPYGRPSMHVVCSAITRLPIYFQVAEPDPSATFEPQAAGQLWQDISAICESFQKTPRISRAGGPNDVMGTAGEPPPVLVPVPEDPVSSGQESQADGDASASSSAFVDTPLWAVQMSLTSTMQRWSCNSPAGTCCEYHSAARVLGRLLKEMRRRPCAKLIPPSSWQCPNCGMLDKVLDEQDGNECDMCGYCEGEGEGEMYSEMQDAREADAAREVKGSDDCSSDSAAACV